MYCNSCGKQIADDAVFCRYCGKPTPQGDALAWLVTAARTGDQDAISALFEKTYSKVYYTVKSMIKDEDAVFDIVQDTYMKAFAHLDSFQGDVKFLPWVRQIAANAARDHLKRKRPMLFTELGSGEGQDTPVEELFPDERNENLPDQVIDQQETKRLIREILQELPEDQRAAIGMFYYEEMSIKEIAAAMGVSESAVKSRLVYGRGKIEKKVLELEKQGTKLYSLSPLPFLLLLFRNQEAYAAEMPDSRILQALLASQPRGAAAAVGAAQGGGTTGGTAGTEAAGAGTAGAAAGTATAGTTAAAGGLGALKVGLIVFAAVAVVGLGAFGVTQIVSNSAEPEEPSTVEDIIDEEKPEESEPIDEEESEAPEESDPIDEALEQYRIIISQAESYEYGEYAEANQSWQEFIGYRYALVQMQPDDPVPTLLLEKEIMDTELSVSSYYARVFQYDPDTKTVHQPTEAIGDGGIRGGLSMAGDGYGIMSMSWSGGTGEGSVIRITLDRDSLNRDTYWSGQIFEMPDSITFIEIEWHEIGDLSTLDSWTAPNPDEAVQSESSISYIFSNMPVAAYEITGLGVGRFESVNEGEIYVEDTFFGGDGFYYDEPFVRLTPGENTFVLFCMHHMNELKLDENGGSYYSSVSEATTIHSPAGSSQWEAIQYLCWMGLFNTSGDFSALYRIEDGYLGYNNEEIGGGGFYSVFFATEKKVGFSEIYHPDSPQNDAIYVVELETYPGKENYEDIDTMLAALVNTFELHGATSVKEIPVEEALERCNVVVSEGDAN